MSTPHAHGSLLFSVLLFLLFFQPVLGSAPINGSNPVAFLLYHGFVLEPTDPVSVSYDSFKQREAWQVALAVYSDGKLESHEANFISDWSLRRTGEWVDWNVAISNVTFDGQPSEVAGLELQLLTDSRGDRVEPISAAFNGESIDFTTAPSSFVAHFQSSISWLKVPKQEIAIGDTVLLVPLDHLAGMGEAVSGAPGLKPLHFTLSGLLREAEVTYVVLEHESVQKVVIDGVNAQLKTAGYSVHDLNGFRRRQSKLGFVLTAESSPEEWIGGSLSSQIDN